MNINCDAAAGQMLAVQAGEGIETGSRRYLATFTYAPTQDAEGTFVVDVLPYHPLQP